MHFINLLPCIVTLATPALGIVIPLPAVAAEVYDDVSFKGDKVDITNHSCVNLDGNLYRNVKSIETHDYRFIALFVVECKLYSNDGCKDASYFETVTMTTESLSRTDVASIFCSYKTNIPGTP